MLRVNLLPTQKRAKVANIEKEVILFVFTLLLIGIGIFFVNQRLSNRTASLESKKDSLVKIKKSLEPKLERIKEIEKTISQIEKKLKVIKRIRTKQSLPVQYLNNLVKELPRKKIWFNSLKMNSQGHINLTGIALDNQAFASYVKDLRSTRFVEDVKLKQTSRKKIKGLDLISFRCLVQSSPLEQVSAASN